MEDAALRARLHANFALLERFARALQAIARSEHGERQELSRFVLAPGAGRDESPSGLDIEPLRVNPSSLIPNPGSLIANPQS